MTPPQVDAHCVSLSPTPYRGQYQRPGKARSAVFCEQSASHARRAYGASHASMPGLAQCQWPDGARSAVLGQPLEGALLWLIGLCR